MNKYLTQEQQEKMDAIKAFRLLPEERQNYFRTIRTYVDADWTYEYSDDASVWRRWSKRLPEIIQEAKDLNDPELDQLLSECSQNRSFKEVREKYPMIEYVRYADESVVPQDVVGATMLFDELLLDRLMDYAKRLYEIFTMLDFDPGGRFFWTKYAPDQNVLRNYAEQTKNTQYYGIAASEKLSVAIQELAELPIDISDDNEPACNAMGNIDEPPNLLALINKFYLVRQVSDDTLHMFYYDYVHDLNLDKAYVNITAKNRSFSYFIKQ